MTSRSQQAADVLLYLRAEGFDVPPVSRVKRIREIRMGDKTHDDQRINATGYAYEGTWIGENFAARPVFVWWVKAGDDEISATYMNRLSSNWNIWPFNDEGRTRPVFIGELNGQRVMVTKPWSFLDDDRLYPTISQFG